MCKWGTDKRVKLNEPMRYSKRKYAFVDKCISDIIIALNKAHINTIASCCGHFKDVGWIHLKDGRELQIFYPNSYYKKYKVKHYLDDKYKTHVSLGGK